MVKRRPPTGISSEDWSVTPKSVQGLVSTLLAVAEQWRQTVPPLQEQVEHLQGQVKQQQGRIDQLEEQLRQNSRHSSKAPSSDPPGVKKAPPKAKGERKQGGQPGRLGKGRRLKPADEVSRFVVSKPMTCRQCGTLLMGEDPQPERHQVWELPPIVPEIIEYQLHTLTCLHCGQRNRGEWPIGWPPGSFGPRVQALLAYLSGRFHLSRRDMVEMMPAVFQVAISLGAVSDQEAQVSQALSEPADEARSYVQQQGHVNADETSWRKNHKQQWLWTAVTPLVTIFLIVTSRGADGARQLLSHTFAGTTGSDRWSGYNWLDARRRQLCGAHWRRDFQALVERKGESAVIGQGLLRQAALMFDLWYRVRDGTLPRRDFQVAMTPIRREITAYLELGTFVNHRQTAKSCTNILAVQPALWTFVDQEGVAPTNNAAERALRRAVLWRKRSFGSQSDRGLRFTERILTTITTLRQQQRSALDYLTAACQAQHLGLPAPSLIPVTAQPDSVYTT